MEISAALVGSCTNSSYEDITRAASIARLASANGLKAKTKLMVTPGSERVHATIVRDGLLDDLEAIGAVVLANACGPCIGQWARDDVKEGDVNVIVNSYNRNFPKRNDGLASTLAFVTSPETVVALALAGRLDFDPSRRHAHQPGRRRGSPRGARRRRAARRRASNRARPGSSPRRPTAAAVEVQVDPASDRLQLLEPFAAWDGKDFVDLPVLVKAKGKCTTDHISAAGAVAEVPRPPREHLGQPVPRCDQRVHRRGRHGQGSARRDRPSRSPTSPSTTTRPVVGWVAIGDENYGEGSSREHAAMEPRFRNAKAVITRSFARIHETNLKKQGVLPLTFADPVHLRPDRRGRPHLDPRPRRPRARRCRLRRASPSPTARRSTSRATTR